MLRITSMRCAARLIRIGSRIIRSMIKTHNLLNMKGLCVRLLTLIKRTPKSITPTKAENSSIIKQRLLIRWKHPLERWMRRWNRGLKSIKASLSWANTSTVFRINCIAILRTVLPKSTYPIVQVASNLTPRLAFQPSLTTPKGTASTTPKTPWVSPRPNQTSNASIFRKSWNGSSVGPSTSTPPTKSSFPVLSILVLLRKVKARKWAHFSIQSTSIKGSIRWATSYQRLKMKARKSKNTPTALPLWHKRRNRNTSKPRRRIRSINGTVGQLWTWRYSTRVDALWKISILLWTLVSVNLMLPSNKLWLKCLTKAYPEPNRGKTIVQCRV